MMNKFYKILLSILIIGAVVISCKEHKHGEDTHTHDSPAMEKADMAMNDVYQCPMDCEKGKTYDEKGNCAHCGMEMKKVEPKAQGETEKEADSSDHKHKDGDQDGHKH